MSLQVWLPLDGDTRNLGLDNTVLTSGSLAWFDNGKTGGKSMNVQTAYVQGTPASLVNAKVFSVCFWGKANSDSSFTNNWEDIVNFTDKKSDGTTGSFRFEGCWGSSLRGCSWHNNATYALTNGSVTIEEEKDVWYHAAVVMDGTKVYTYLNGSQIGSVYNQNDGMLTGFFKVGGNNYRGQINDFRIYDHALSPKEIKEISKGLILHFPMNEIDGVIGGRNLVKNSSSEWETVNVSQWNGSVKERVHCSEYGLSVGDTFTYSIDLNSINKIGLQARVDVYSTATGETGKTAYKSTEYIPTGESGRCSVTVTIQEGKEYIWLAIQNYNTTDDTTHTVEKYRCVKLEKGSVATPYSPAPEDYPFMEDNIVYDASGYGNHGTVTDTTCPSWDSDSPVGSGSYKFDGTNIAKTDLNLTFGKIFSVSYWVKFNDLENETDWGRTYYFIDATGKYTISTAINANNKSSISLSIGDHTSGTNVWIIDNYAWTGLVDNQWYHIAYTIDGTNFKAYLNGNLIITSTAGTGQSFKDFNIQELYIGSGSNSAYANINLADFKLYSTALSDTDIKELYQTRFSLADNGTLYCTELNEFDEDGVINVWHLNETSNEYGFGIRTVQLEANKKYALTCNGYTTNADTKLAFYVYKNDWSQLAHTQISSLIADTKTVYFTPTVSGEYEVAFYSFKASQTAGSNVHVNWATLTEVNEIDCNKNGILVTPILSEEYEKMSIYPNAVAVREIIEL